MRASRRRPAWLPNDATVGLFQEVFSLGRDAKIKRVSRVIPFHPALVGGSPQTL